MASIRGRSLRGARVIALRGVGVRAVGLLGSIVLARLLLPSDFGVLAFGFTLVAVGSFLTDAGLAAGLVRSAAAPTREQLAALLGLQVTVTAVLLGLTAAGLTLASQELVTLVMLASLLPGAFRVPAVVQLERDLSFGAVAVAEVLETLLYTLLAIALVVGGFGVWGVAVATLVRPLPGLVVLQRAAPLRVLRPSTHWRTVWPLVVFGLTFQASRVMVLVRDQGVNVVTALLAGTTTLGLWALAQRVMLLPFLLFETLWRVSFPAISRLLEAGHDVRADLMRALRVAGLLTGLFVVPLAASAPALVPLLFGPQWAPVVPVIPLASAGLILSGPVSAVGAGYLSAVGKVRVVALAQAATLVPWALVLLLLLPAVGVLAHGVAWGLASLTEAVVLGIALVRQVRVPVLRALAGNAACALAAGGSAYALLSGREPAVLDAAVAVIGSVLLYLALLCAFAPAGPRDAWNVLRLRRVGTAPGPAR